MQWAPLRIPLRRRIQTFGVVYMLHQTWIALWVGLALSVYLMIATSFFWLPLLYAAWYWYDFNRDERGGRRSQLFRRICIAKWASDYFPVKLIKTAELPADRNYIFGSHPHGIISACSILNFATEGTNFSKVFPGIVPHPLTLRMNFFLPFYRELMLLSGTCSSSKASIRWILNKKGQGNAAILVIGGAQEALDAHPGSDYVLTLTSRKGFVKQALVNGADLVPVFCFGENDLYHQVKNPPGSILRNLQEAFKRLVGFSPPLFSGRGVFQYSYGHLPFRRPLTCVVGAPIRVQRTANPTEKQINTLHARYVSELTDLFEKHKATCGEPERQLIIP